ncbi:urease accessory protein UreD [Enterobacteriaceae bacterium C23F]
MPGAGRKSEHTGWRATLDLRFRPTPEKTVLASARHSGPLTVQRPFWPEGETCHLYLLHPPGGIVGGDELTINVSLEANSHALITMPGASKFYRSAGPQARLSQRFEVGENAILEWLPQDTIFFPAARATLRSIFHLQEGARLLAWELFCLGRPVIGERFHEGEISNRLEVWKNGEPLLIERLHLRDGDLSAVAEQPWTGSLLFYPADETMLESVRENLAPLETFAGATLADGLLAVRFLSHDNLICQRAMRDVWQQLRPQLLHKSPLLPRIWLT